MTSQEEDRRRDAARLCRELADRGFYFSDHAVACVIGAGGEDEAGKWRALADMIDDATHDMHEEDAQ
jgi:hypothetical protein